MPVFLLNCEKRNDIILYSEASNTENLLFDIDIAFSKCITIQSWLSDIENRIYVFIPSGFYLEDVRLSDRNPYGICINCDCFEPGNYLANLKYGVSYEFKNIDDSSQSLKQIEFVSNNSIPSLHLNLISENIDYIISDKQNKCEIYGLLLDDKGGGRT